MRGRADLRGSIRQRRRGRPFAEIKILVERDRRERVAAGSGLEGLAEANENLSALDELAVARARLSEENLTDEDRMAFEGLLAEVIAEVKSGLVEGE